MQFILQGVANDGSGLQPHQVILIVTDLTKVINHVPTVVLWDRDFNSGVLKESELAFHAQDKAGNIWNLGEYPAQYVNGQFTDAPDTWIEGLAGAQGGTVIPGNPKVGMPKFLQAYAPDPQSGQPPIIQDCGQVSAVGQHFCNIIGCYDNVLVVDETSPPEKGTQQKYYAPGVGNFNIGAINNDPQGETLVLSETLHLGREDCLAARQSALALEDQAYHDTSQNVYGLTTRMEQTGYCESLPPSTPTPTPPSAPNPNIYLPIVAKSSAAPPPALYDGCKSTPDPASAPNYPVRIVTVDKVAEVVTLENVSTTSVSLEDWNMCSLYTHQDHDQIFGTIAPGQQRSFKNIGGYGPVWDDNHRNDGALYNAAGVLVSYWIDQ